MLRKLCVVVVSVLGLPAMLLVTGCATGANGGIPQAAGPYSLVQHVNSAQVATPSDADLILAN